MALDEGSTRKLLQAGCLWAIALFSAGGPISGQVPSDSLGALTDKTIQIRVNGRAVTEATPESGKVSIDSVRVTVRSGDQVKALLRRQDIVPDAAAIALFYELNPAVRDADQLIVGSSLVLPAVTASDSTASSVAGRLSFAVIADTMYKAVLIDQAKRITQLTDSLQAASNRPAQARLINANAEKIAGAVETLSRASIPLSRETAAELSIALNEYEARVQQALMTVEPAQEVLTVAGRQVVGEATAIAAAASSGTNNHVELDFSVIDTTGRDRPNVKVVYARPMFENVANRRESFVKRSSPIVRNAIALGPWRIWVEDLTGIEVSVKRQTIRVTRTSREVTLIAK